MAILHFMSNIPLEVRQYLLDLSEENDNVPEVYHSVTITLPDIKVAVKERGMYVPSRPVCPVSGPEPTTNLPSAYREVHIDSSQK